MAIIDDVKSLLEDLAPHGWKELLAAHGLDIVAADLERELARDLSATVDRDLPGFREFALEGHRGITPSNPARSLLYHALATPEVRWRDARKQQALSKYPTLAQIETVENYVYAARKTSLRELELLHGRENIAVVVLANQYRGSSKVPHRKHADLVYSRTGIARVGTAAASYNAKDRSYEPFDDGDAAKVRVLPCKYDAYIAVRMKGSRPLLGEGFNLEQPIDFSSIPEDERLDFWHPVHKLFDGTECLAGVDLQLVPEASHVNEKLRKIHRFVLETTEESPGSTQAQRRRFPFEIREGIASYGSGWLVPDVHEALVEAAEVDGEFVTLDKRFPLPTESEGASLGLFSSSLELRAADAVNPISTVPTGSQRSVPEYAHIRTAVIAGGTENLNERPDLEGTLSDDRYRALHYIDYTGDGSVSIVAGGHGVRDLIHIAAYSLVAPPDFFPYCEQSTLMDSRIDSDVWSRPPQALSDIRLLPNVKSHPQLAFEGMQPFDTCTALVNGTLDEGLAQARLEPESVNRISHLADGASGVFAPGWDTSFDMLAVGHVNVPILAAYGLGSPFPEDAKLCASISSFWPAAAPDTARSFWPEARARKTVIPMTDEEIGSDGTVGWDGEHGPQLSDEGGNTTVTYKRYDRVDYTLNAAENRFNYHKLRGIDADAYLTRVVSYQRAIAELRVSRPILISYRIDPNGTHHYRFMLAGREVAEDLDHVTLEVTREARVQVGSDGVAILVA
ncbi:MAG: hypothetical protein KUG77_11565 [Nannocystaceae bacterium]|nr:hypothetical protein [Nannocystaceae bacterium]